MSNTLRKYVTSPTVTIISLVLLSHFPGGYASYTGPYTTKGSVIKALLGLQYQKCKKNINTPICVINPLYITLYNLLILRAPPTLDGGRG